MTNDPFIKYQGKWAYKLVNLGMELMQTLTLLLIMVPFHIT